MVAGRLEGSGPGCSRYPRQGRPRVVKGELSGPVDLAHCAPGRKAMNICAVGHGMMGVWHSHAPQRSRRGLWAEAGRT